MQRTKRRVSASTISNASTRGIRRSSRTSSAGGDCPPIRANSNRYDITNEGKLKLRSGRHNSRLIANAARNQIKKVSKFQRPTFGSLQNTVVLAPFYTLKRCFQTKLVDLYSQERQKKLNKKIKLAKKQNVSFEYDVVEVKKPFGGKVAARKEATKKKKAVAQKAKNKRGNGSRSQSYCQCDRNQIKAGKLPNKKFKDAKRSLRCRVTKSPAQRERASRSRTDVHLALSLYDNQKNNTKRVGNELMAVAPLYNEDFGLDYLKSSGNIPKDTIESTSNISSKKDSWETFSDSMSLKEYLEGSLAISTTSFDSCLEQSSRDKVNKPGMYRYNTRLREVTAQNETATNRPEGFPPTSKTNQSRHLIMSSELKSSDDRITDFMDREPQPQGIAFVSISENLQPLPHLSRSKGKKPGSESVTSATNNYYLRSVQTREEAQGGEEGGHTSYVKSASTSQRLLDHSNGRQVSQNAGVMSSLLYDDNVESRRENPSCTKQQQQSDKQTHFILMPQSKTVEESSSQTEDISGPFQSNTAHDLTKEESLQGLEAEKLIRTELKDSNSEILPKEHSNLLTDEQTNSKSQSNGEDKTRDTGTSREEAKERERPWNGLPSEMESDDRCPNETQMLARLREDGRFQGLPPAGLLPRRTQAKKSSFIFGPRSDSARLGESCEFTFGVNWAISDEDDSDEGDNFY